MNQRQTALAERVWRPMEEAPRDGRIVRVRNRRGIEMTALWIVDRSDQPDVGLWFVEPDVVRRLAGGWRFDEEIAEWSER